jgi:hypothetical protein
VTEALIGAVLHVAEIEDFGRLIAHADQDAQPRVSRTSGAQRGRDRATQPGTWRAPETADCVILELEQALLKRPRSSGSFMPTAIRAICR